MARQTLLQPFRRIVVFHLAHDQRVIRDIFTGKGVRSSGLLVLNGIPDQEAIGGPRARSRKSPRRAGGGAFYPERRNHFGLLRSNTLGWLSSFVMRGARFTGASKAAWNLAHCLASSPKR